jgi:hypothetical protein
MFFRIFIEGRVERVRGGFCNPHLLNKQQKCIKVLEKYAYEIRCEMCINHFVEIIFTLSCAVVDINLLQINCCIQCSLLITVLFLELEVRGRREIL